MVRPLHLAAITNHLDIVKLLIDKGANPTKQDSDGDVPLHWAATKGHAEVSNAYDHLCTCSEFCMCSTGNNSLVTDLQAVSNSLH